MDRPALASDPSPATDPLSDRALCALVDRLLLEQGRLDPLELLLAAGLLGYQDYEAWRTGRRADIEGALHRPPAEVAGLLERAGAYARGQRLAAVPVEHRGWGGFDRPLQIGNDPGLVQGCAHLLVPPPDRHQMDLFHDSSALLLEEEIRRSLAERRIDSARDQLARLMRQDPHHVRVRGFLRLIQTVDETGSGNAEERLGELDGLEPLARQLLGHRARDFLAPLWTDLAERLSGQPFDHAAPRLHASHAWARAGRWLAVCESIESEPCWRAEPDLVLAHAEGAWRLGLIAAAHRDWAGLCWEHPEVAERVLGSSAFPDQRLAGLWKRFLDLDDELETEDFPAWLLLQDRGAAATTPDAAPQEDRGAAYRLLHRLVTGEDRIELRRELSEAHPALLGLYLRKRG